MLADGVFAEGELEVGDCLVHLLDYVDGVQVAVGLVEVLVFVVHLHLLDQTRDVHRLVNLFVKVREDLTKLVSVDLDLLVLLVQLLQALRAVIIIIIIYV